MLLFDRSRRTPKPVEHLDLCEQSDLAGINFLRSASSQPDLHEFAFRFCCRKLILKGPSPASFSSFRNHKTGFNACFCFSIFLQKILNINGPLYLLFKYHIEYHSSLRFELTTSRIRVSAFNHQARTHPYPQNINILLIYLLYIWVGHRQILFICL